MSTSTPRSLRNAHEDTPLLGRPGKSSVGNRRWTQLKSHMNENVSRNWADLVLLWCYVITGLLDSCAVFIWGSFVSMQTGNTVYLGLGLVAPSEGVRWIKALTSISFFCLGSFLFSRFHRQYTPRKRWVLILSYSIQLLFIVLAALIATLGDDTADGLHWQVLVPLASVAFQSSGQAVTSRTLQYPALTSVVLTSVYCDLFSDQNLLAVSNIERNQRIAAPLLLLLGAMGGGLYAHSSIGLAGALWTAVALKAVAVIAWMFWKAEHTEE